MTPFCRLGRITKPMYNRYPYVKFHAKINFVSLITNTLRMCEWIGQVKVKSYITLKFTYQKGMETLVLQRNLALLNCICVINTALLFILIGEIVYCWKEQIKREKNLTVNCSTICIILHGGSLAKCVHTVTQIPQSTRSSLK